VVVDGVLVDGILLHLRQSFLLDSLIGVCDLSHGRHALDSLILFFVDLIELGLPLFATGILTDLMLNHGTLVLLNQLLELHIFVVVQGKHIN